MICHASQRRTLGFQRARRGLTLLELVVVIAILAALAGILVPLLPNVIFKAHASAGATNLGEIAKAVQLFNVENGNSYPNQLDNLANSSGLLSYVPTDGTSLTTDALNANDVQALAGGNGQPGCGITAVAQIVASKSDGTWSPTFNPYDLASGTSPSTIMTPIPYGATSGPTAAFLNPAVAAAKLGATNNGVERYVVFGLGKFATCVGQTMDEAPVWYNPTAGQDPDQVYCRFGLVFQTVGFTATTTYSGGTPSTTYAANPFPVAKLIGVIEFASFGTMTKDDNLSFYYSLQ